MAQGGTKVISTILNLAILAGIIIGAGFGYYHFIVEPRKEREWKRKPDRLFADASTEKEWQEALKEYEKLGTVHPQFKAYCRKRTFDCYIGLVNESERKAHKADRFYHRAKKKDDEEEMAKYKRFATKFYQKILDYLKLAEQYGQLSRKEIMSRSQAYFSLGDKEKAKEIAKTLGKYKNPDD